MLFLYLGFRGQSELPVVGLRRSREVLGILQHIIPTLRMYSELVDRRIQGREKDEGYDVVSYHIWWLAVQLQSPDHSPCR
jgi:hypothetical protein